jgi:hypothetical protein
MFKEYRVFTTVGDIVFKGKYRKDLETPNWHYYEREDGIILHFRKEYMIAVIGDTSKR